MARKINRRDITPVLEAAEQWINSCVLKDGSVFSRQSLWNPALLDEAYRAFADHPDQSDDDFMTKLKRQMENSSAGAKQLMAELLWALLLFISNTGPRVKRQQVRDIWALSGQQLSEDHPMLSDSVLIGVASGGPAFTILRPVELKFLMDIIRNLKAKTEQHRTDIARNYDAFMTWIETVPREGSRQYRHMLRYFAFPDSVERISSNRDRRRILEAYEVVNSVRETKHWTDKQLDSALFKLRGELQAANGDKVLDFYEPPLKERWAGDRKVKTAHGEITVEVPSDEDEEGEDTETSVEDKTPEARQSIQIQAKLAQIGIALGFRIWVPRSDKARVLELMPQEQHSAFLDELPLNYNDATIETIEQIDVIWLRNQAIVRAFEVEHTTAVYSGLLRMADLLSLQQNIAIRLHIVAPDERRDKVRREMKRPVFRLLGSGPLSESCTYISYDSVNAISSLKHLDRMKDDIVMEYEEKADA